VQAQKNYFASLGFLLCVAAAAMGLGYRMRTPEQEQIGFITGFYQNYLALPEMKRAEYLLPPGSFYTKSAEGLLAENGRLCRLLRNDDICGYDADWDMLLHAQEIDPKLTFAKAGFRVVVSGKNTVDVCFNVYPEYGADYDRNIRYVLVRENGGWRVDDVFSGDGGRFPVKESMRYEINAENQRVQREAGEIAEAAVWVFSYLREADMVDRAERFVAFPIKVCSESGNCETLQQGDARVHDTMLALHEAYYRGDSDTTVLEGFLPQPGQVRGEQGKVVQLDALEFTYQGQAWWITKIDLRDLGRTIPLQRPWKSGLAPRRPEA
jgi:hypothetical protein